MRLMFGKSTIDLSNSAPTRRPCGSGTTPHLGHRDDQLLRISRVEGAQGGGEEPSERLVRDIRRAARKQYSAEEKIRIVLDGLQGGFLFVLAHSRAFRLN